MVKSLAGFVVKKYHDDSGINPERDAKPLNFNEFRLRRNGHEREWFASKP